MKSTRKKWNYFCNALVKGKCKFTTVFSTSSQLANFAISGLCSGKDGEKKEEKEKDKKKKKKKDRSKDKKKSKSLILY